MATEDAISALAYLLEHAKELKLNKEWIVMVGSSAGAITSLQTDYTLCNGYLNAKILPEDFSLAGVVSYAGAIFSTKGAVKYVNHNPAPTMMYHGTADKLVPYKQIKFMKLGFFGTDALVNRFEKFDYPYFARRFEDYGHSVAVGGPLTVDDLLWFCRHYVLNKERIQVDGVYKNLDPTTLPAFDIYTPNDLYK
jgi:predicted esterase